MRKHTKIGVMAGIAVVFGLGLVLPHGQAADMTKDLATKYILATAKAARTVYVKGVIQKAKKSGVMPKENWVRADHAIMLPAQFVKAIGAEIKDFELTLIGTHPVYKSNAPKTDKEKEMLEKLRGGRAKMLTFVDGNQFKGMSADFAIVQGCVDCHNTHPKAVKKDFKKGDFMGAIIVRMKN